MLPSNVQYLKGDIFSHTDKWDIMCHQTNCQGAFGRGIAATVASKYPRVKEAYVELVAMKDNKKDLLGTAQLCAIDNDKYIVNLFGQFNYGMQPNVVYTDYDAFDKALEMVANYAIGLGLNRIAFPYKIGCGLANGDWSTIESYIGKLGNKYKQLDIRIFILQ